MNDAYCPDCGVRFPPWETHVCAKKRGAEAGDAAGHSSRGDASGKGRSADLSSAKPRSSKVAGSNPAGSAKKSTAALKEVPAAGIGGRSARKGHADERSHAVAQPDRAGDFDLAVGGSNPAQQASTQASPVDTPLTVRGTPRKRAPKGTFDRKAYQRKAAKMRRDRKRAEDKGETK